MTGRLAVNTCMIWKLEFYMHLFVLSQTVPFIFYRQKLGEIGLVVILTALLCEYCSDDEFSQCFTADSVICVIVCLSCMACSLCYNEQ